MEQSIKKNKFSYFARSRLRLRPQEIWERDYMRALENEVARACLMNSVRTTRDAQ